MKRIAFALCCLSVNAMAWGPTGHRTVGEIAEKYLTGSARLAVNQILQGKSMARVANWPDEIKSEPVTYAYTFNWHYTDWPDDMDHHDETRSTGTLINAINQNVAALRNPDTTAAEKNFALKFLIHLVGDLHMPLHVGNGLDLGGNNCKVLFHNKATNLHALWDEGMIEFTQLSYSELADFIAEGRSEAETRTISGGQVIDWAHESKDLRGDIYPADPVASTPPLYNYCRRDITVPQEQLPKLAYEYSYRFMPVVEQRLFEAGVRLAKILNDIY